MPMMFPLSCVWVNWSHMQCRGVLYGCKPGTIGRLKFLDYLKIRLETYAALFKSCVECFLLVDHHPQNDKRGSYKAASAEALGGSVLAERCGSTQAKTV